MNGDWVDDTLDPTPVGLAGWCRLVLRGGVLAVLIFGGLLALLVMRLAERPIFGAARPMTPYITQFVCKSALWIMGIGLRIRGTPMVQHGAVVANHGSWLDIFALNAAQRVYFVSKSEVAGWPGIGWLARATGTLFIARKSTDAKVQQMQFEARLRAGNRLLFFPEGTSTDTLRVLPFKTTLFAAFYTHDSEKLLHIQPVCVVYHAPKRRDARFYGWWADMDFAAHLMTMLASSRHGYVEVILQDPVAVDQFSNRKDLSAYCEGIIRATHQQHMSTV